MNKIFKNKMFIIFASFFVLFILSNSKVFASSGKEISFSYNNKDYNVSLPEEYFQKEYTFLVLSKLGSLDNPYYYFYLYSSDEPLVVKDGNSYGKLVHLLGINNDTSFGDIGFVRYNIAFGASFDIAFNALSKVETFSPIDTTTFSTSSLDFDRDTCLYSNFTLVNITTSETVFQGAPRTQVEPLTEITQVEEIQPVVAKIVGLVLPACLTIFGVLLVLYLMVSKNLLQL